MVPNYRRSEPAASPPATCEPKYELKTPRSPCRDSRNVNRDAGRCRLSRLVVRQTIDNSLRRWVCSANDSHAGRPFDAHGRSRFFIAGNERLRTSDRCVHSLRRRLRVKFSGNQSCKCGASTRVRLAQSVRKFRPGRQSVCIDRSTGDANVSDATIDDGVQWNAVGAASRRDGTSGATQCIEQLVW